MTEANAKQESFQRSRRKWEDTLLHARTGVFLIMNGFAVQKPSVWLASSVVAVNILWIIASFQSWELIRSLARTSQNTGAQVDVNAVLGVRSIHYMFRPTTLIALWIPALVHLAWLYYIGAAKAKCWAWVIAGAAFLLPFAILFLLHVTKRKAHNKPSGVDVQ